MLTVLLPENDRSPALRDLLVPLLPPGSDIRDPDDGLEDLAGRRLLFAVALDEGGMPNLFLKRPGVIRSLHPTHSMAGYGKDAASYLAGEEMRNTPCTSGGCYDRLKDIGGKILLVGVGHERNTYIHSVEEVLNVPNRLSDMPVLMKIVQHGKKPVSVYMRKHYNSQQPHISEDFVKLNRAFDECGAAVHTVFGSAECILCDARRIFEVTRHVLAPEPECLVTGGEIAPERWQELIR